MPWVSLLILVPLAAALALVFVPQHHRHNARVVALVGAGLTLVISVVILVMFDRSSGVIQMTNHLDWISSVGLAWDVGVDGISIWLVLLTTVLFTLAIIAACHHLPERGSAFLSLLLLSEVGLLGLFTSGDLVLFYVFWEFMLVPLAFLIWMWGGRDRARAGFTFVVYTMLGSLIMLVAIVATAVLARDATGQFTFQIQDLRGVPFSSTASTLLFAGFVLAFAIKLPLWPFHGWMPMAYTQAPIVVAGLLAAVMSKAGVYGLMRVGVPLFPEGAHNLTIPIAILALIGIIYGSLLAWRATTMRLLVGYSSLAHLGFIVLGIMVFDPLGAQGSVLQMINHGIVVAAAFTIVMVLARGSDTEDIDRLGGMAKGAPRMAAAFLIVTLAALAIPGSNSFVGEFFILAGVFRQYAWMGVIAMLGVIFAAVYMLRMYQTTMNGPVRGVREDGRPVELTRADALVLLPMLALMVWIAIWPASLVGGSSLSVDRAIAPAQIAAGRPPSQIAAQVIANPPPSQLPLPGDEPAGQPAPGAQP